MEEPNAYELLELDETASEEDIKRSYKKLALKNHPDKNRNNPKAGDLFRKLVLAYELLRDPAAKAALDMVVKSKRANAARLHAMNAQQRKAREELDEKERSKRAKYEEKDAASRLAAEVRRLREESGARMLAEEERLRKEMRAQTKTPDVAEEPATYVLEVAWSLNDVKPEYNEDTLQQLFIKYGDVDVALSRKKPGRAFLSFHSLDAMLLMIAQRRAQLYEKGFPSNPLLAVDFRSPPVAGTSSPRHSAPPSEGRASPAAKAAPPRPSDGTRELDILARMKKMNEERMRAQAAASPAAPAAPAAPAP